MSEWLEKFDGLSFWLGFLVACLVWFLVGRLRPAIARLREQMRARSSTSQHEKASLDEVLIAGTMFASGWIFNLRWVFAT